MGILDWLYPPTCIACGSLIPLNQTKPRHMVICNFCQGLFQPVEAPLCKICGSPTLEAVERCVSCFGKTFYFTHNQSTFPYSDLIRDLLLELKFKQKKQIAKGLGHLWANHAPTHLAPDNTYLVPLPLHPQKQKERGFNQADILAKALGKARNIPIAYVLQRTIDTPPQSGLHPRQRIENVQGAFAIAKGQDPRGKNYIVVDDIYTTGASVNECAKVLLAAGANRVSSLTLSIVVRQEAEG